MGYQVLFLEEVDHRSGLYHCTWVYLLIFSLSEGCFDTCCLYYLLFHWDSFQISFLSDFFPDDYWDLISINIFLYYKLACPWSFFVMGSGILGGSLFISFSQWIWGRTDVFTQPGDPRRPFGLHNTAAQTPCHPTQPRWILPTMEAPETWIKRPWWRGCKPIVTLFFLLPSMTLTPRHVMYRFNIQYWPCSRMDVQIIITIEMINMMNNSSLKVNDFII